MANRKKAPATIIKEQAAEIEKLTKELSDVKRAKDSYYESWQASRKEIDEVHTMLDAFMGVPRQTEPLEGGYRSPTPLSLMARLAIMLAKKESAHA
jgi:hypothetical protein